MKDLSSVRDVGSWRSWMTLVVCNDMSKRLGQMTCPRRSIVLAKKRQWLILVVAAALLRMLKA